MKNNRFISWIWKKQLLLSFLLGMLLYYLIFSYAQMAGGKFTFLMGDAFEIYIPTIKNIINKLFSDGYFYYSWNNSLGMNTSGLYAFYGQLFSLPALLFLCIPFGDINTITIMVAVLKAGLSSMSFNFLARKKLGISDFYALLFSLMYSLCAYQISMNSINIIWMDAMYILPVIIYLIYEICEGRKLVLLPIAYAYLFLTNFYMGYVVGFFSFITLILLLIFGKYKNKVKTILKFAGSVVLAAAVSAAVLLPACYFFLNKGAEDATSIYSYSFNLLGVYNQLFLNAGHLEANEMPYIYCGLPAVIGLPCFFLAKKIERKDKMIYGIVLGILLLSCVIYPIFLFWHAFDVPDGWNYRFSFLISFVLCCIGGMVYSASEVFEGKYFKFAAGINLVYCLVYSIIAYVLDKSENDYFYVILGTNIIFVVLYILLRNYKQKKDCNQRAFAVFLCFVVCIELVINGLFAFYGDSSANPTKRKDSFDAWYQRMENMSARMDKEDLFRVNLEGETMYNADSMFLLNGISDFASTENYKVRRVLYRLGGYTSARISGSYSMNDFVKMLTSVRYDIYSPAYQKYYNDVDTTEMKLCEMPYYCGMGFLVDDEMLDFSFEMDSERNNVFENCNRLASCITGEDIVLYEFADASEVEFLEESIFFEDREDGQYWIGDHTREGAKYLLITAPIDDRQAYIQFDYGKSTIINEAPAIPDGVENIEKTNGRISVSYMKEMNRYADCFETSVVMTDNTVQEYPVPNAINIAYYNEENMRKVYHNVSEYSLKVDEYADGYVRAHIDMNNDNKILYTSIPYDEGWTVYANGKEIQPIALLDGAFIGLDLEPGNYELVFQYEAPGAKEGLVVSGTAILIYVIWVVSSYVYQRKKAKKVSD